MKDNPLAGPLAAAVIETTAAERLRAAADGSPDALGAPALAALMRLAAQPAKVPGEVTDALRLLHELLVHQHEIEMQRDELQLQVQRIEADRVSERQRFDALPVAVLEVDVRSIVLRANLRALALLGTDAAPLRVGHPLLHRWPAEQQLPLLAALRRAAKGEALAFETTAGSGGDVPLRWQAGPAPANVDEDAGNEEHARAVLAVWPSNGSQYG